MMMTIGLEYSFYCANEYDEHQIIRFSSFAFQAHAAFDIIHNINVTSVSPEMALQVSVWSFQEFVFLVVLRGHD